MAEALTLARPYARAAFEVADAAAALDTWSVALLSAAAAVRDPDVAGLLGSPALPGERLAALIVDVIGSAPEGVSRLVHELARNKRLALLPEISTQFEVLRAERQKTVAVEIQTAFDVPEALLKSLAVALKRRLQREISVSTTMDPSLIGGAVIRAGDTVIDASVRGRLSKLAEALNA